MFWESVNAIGVLHAPAVIAIYDDGFGISVPNSMQMVKEDIHAILKGFERAECPAELCDRGFDLYSASAWDYPALLAAFAEAGEAARRYHIPSLIHVTDVTQPLGHSTSGSHEQYKSPERLAWESENDCLPRFRGWIHRRAGLATSAMSSTALEADGGGRGRRPRKRRPARPTSGPFGSIARRAIALIGALSETSPKAEEPARAPPSRSRSCPSRCGAMPRPPSMPPSC